jgi:hypothetical protein
MLVPMQVLPVAALARRNAPAHDTPRPPLRTTVEVCFTAYDL